MAYIGLHFQACVEYATASRLRVFIDNLRYWISLKRKKNERIQKIEENCKGERLGL
jgi:hypothetical protein